MKRYYPQLIGIIVCLGLGFASGFLTQDAVSTWYKDLNTPSFNPPAYIFGPVWSCLYIMIGIAAGKLWSARQQYPILWSLFLVQLVFNFAWTPLFFALHRIDLALIDITLLWVTLALLMFKDRHERIVLYWLLPYFAWVSFATVLNISLYTLN